MRFSDNGYYIERYIKCDNCGVLIYDEAGLDTEVKGEHHPLSRRPVGDGAI